MNKPVESLEDILRMYYLLPFDIERTARLIEMAMYLGAKLALQNKLPEADPRDIPIKELA